VSNAGDDPNKKCATLQPGQTAFGAAGETGYSVEFYRTITQPGVATRVEHYTWNYTMTPDITLVGPGTPTTTAPTSTTPGASTTVGPTTTTSP
jgi:hypothetical protein